MQIRHSSSIMVLSAVKTSAPVSVITMVCSNWADLKKKDKRDMVSWVNIQTVLVKLWCQILRVLFKTRTYRDIFPKKILLEQLLFLEIEKNVQTAQNSNISQWEVISSNWRASVFTAIYKGSTLECDMTRKTAVQWAPNGRAEYYPKIREIRESGAVSRIFG